MGSQNLGAPQGSEGGLVGSRGGPGNRGSRFWGADEALTKESGEVHPSVWRDSTGGPQTFRSGFGVWERLGGSPGVLQESIQEFRVGSKGPGAFEGSPCVWGSPVFKGEYCRSWGQWGMGELEGSPQEFWSYWTILGRRQRSAARADGRDPHGAAH